jgi:gliding motility-associated-like protein
VIDADSNIGTCEQVIRRWDFPSESDAGPDQENCEEFEAPLAANTPVVGIGTWSVVAGGGTFGDSLNPNSTITDLPPDTTLLEWRIGNGVCPIERDTMVIIEYLLPEPADAGPDQFICDTSLTRLEAVLDSFGTGSWLVPNNGTNISDTTLNDPLVSNLQLGSYTYTWKMVNGVCPVTTDEVEVNVVPYPVVDAGETKYVFFPSDIELEATVDLDVSFAWEPLIWVTRGDTEAVATVRPVRTDLFTVFATTQYGCQTSDTVSVVVNNDLEFPTAFTPDGDGINDVWNLKELSSYPDNRVRIFNRWGHLIFESEGYNTPWDGTFRGEELPSGSYFFTIEFGVKEVIPMSGSVTIIR